MAPRVGRVSTAPQTLESVNVPAPAAAFGVGVGRALQGLGGDLDRLAKAFEQEELQHAQFRAQTEFTQWAAEQRRALAEAQQGAQPGAPNFTNAQHEVLRERANEFIASIEREEVKRRFTPQVEGVVQSIVDGAFEFEMNSRKEFTMGRLDSTLDDAMADLFRSPEDADVWAATIAEQAEAASGLTESERQAYLEHAEAGLQEAVFYGELNSGYSDGVLGEPEIAATDVVPQEGAAFLNAVAGPESAGRYNVRFDGTRDGAVFTDFSEHPGVAERIPEGFREVGSTSTAAGRYQFTLETWKEQKRRLGLPDFSPRSQDIAAWDLAKRRYRANRGPGMPKTLEEALKSDPDAVKVALSGTWEGIDGANLEAIAEADFSVDEAGIPNPFSQRFAGIPFDRRRVLFNRARAEGERRRRESQREFLEGAAGLSFEDDLAFRRLHGESPEGTPFTAVRLAQMFGAEEAANLHQQLSEAQLLGEVRTEVEGSTPAELRELQAEAAAALEDPRNSRFSQEKARLVNDVIEARSKSLREDAAAHLLDTNEQLRGVRNAIDETPGVAPIYANATIAEQERIGVATIHQRVLDKGWASSTVQKLAETESDERGAALNAFLEPWGDHRQQVLEELEGAGLPTGLFYAALYADQPALSQRIAAAYANADDIKARVKSLGRTEDALRDTVSQELQPFFDVFGAGDLTGQALERINELANVGTMYTMLAITQGTDESTAATEFFEQAIDNNYHLVNTGNVRAYMPRTVAERLSGSGDTADVLLDAAKVEDVAAGLLDADTVEQMNVEPFGTVGIEEVDLATTRQAIINNGFWATNSDASGLVLMVPFGERGQDALPVRDTNGNIVELSFLDAMRVPDEVVTGGPIPGNIPLDVLRGLFGG